MTDPPVGSMNIPLVNAPLKVILFGIVKLSGTVIDKIIYVCIADFNLFALNFVLVSHSLAYWHLISETCFNVIIQNSWTVI